MIAPLGKLNRQTGGDFEALKSHIHGKLVEKLDMTRVSELEGDSLRREIRVVVEHLCDTENTMLNRSERERLVEEVLDEAFGFGPLELLLKEDDVADIMINGPKNVFVEKNGRIQRSEVTFRDNEHLMQILDRIVSRVGRRIDETSPMVDARLPDGSRLNAIIPPLALDGPSLTIRRFGSNPLTLEDLLKFGAFTPEMVMFLEGAMKARLNMIISGGTGSGKTTLLNTLSSFISNENRIVTIEDAAELQLQQEHVLRLETRPPNIEGRGRITATDLVRNALRMRPDRIIIGECRGGETLDMLQAMNTGHDGSLTTVHANNPRDAISRIETLVNMSGYELPMLAVRKQIASAVNLIIQASRLQGGSRKVTYITEVIGMEGDVIVMQDIFRFVQDGINDQGKAWGHFESTGVRPRCIEHMESSGIRLPAGLFAQRAMRSM
ncbi:MAG: CpaF family protein [Planctomyces sp.]|jgi:pilus assembly protein CpaF|nr:CpaF family protein [Planctomyces sp.]GDX93074.1 secretion system protein TadA [Planctomycetia bacterium]HAV34397.1 pilus assembly protein CpaF [Planctomycetaceae bacterium]HBC61625.1 pilus assembly protein CpaF [Planctomycetaceae bacterium]